MIAALLITLRETLEASLVVGIILAYLNKTQNLGQKRVVWHGVMWGSILSVVLAFVFSNFLGGFEGRAEQLYEGVTMFVAGALLTWMILWMLTQRKNMKQKIENKVNVHLEGGSKWGLFLLAFVGVAREGIETVIFLQAAAIQSGRQEMFIGGVLGILLAMVLAVILFKRIVKIPLRSFFTFTSVLLILFAAGLMAHGVHEFEEAGVVPVFIEHIWDINPILNEKGVVGSLLAGLFGYNGNPSLVEVLTYLLYMIVIFRVWVLIERKEELVK